MASSRKIGDDMVYKYTDLVLEHFRNPKNAGPMENADAKATEGSLACGDMMTFYIKVKDGRLEDVKYQTFGCGAAIAVSSMVSEMAMGKTLEEALTITPSLVAKELEGLPKQKFHCSNLGAQALRKAIRDYATKKAIILKGLEEKGDEEDEGEENVC